MPSSGLPLERTALAWQRTALSLMAASLAVSRLAYGRLGAWAVLSAALGIPLTGWVFWISGARYRARTGHEGLHSTGGVAPALLVAAVCAMAGTALAAAWLS
ncbi:MAG TPA: DUF202 domain-containing protein [Marmoricola sp.]|jgi:uncharacterized membrane protein YidH (DUF202 family)